MSQAGVWGGETVFHRPMLRFNPRHDRFTDLAVAKFALFPRRTNKMINWRRLFAARVKSKENSAFLSGSAAFYSLQNKPTAFVRHFAT